jgi:hypothetical protein
MQQHAQSNATKQFQEHGWAEECNMTSNERITVQPGLYQCD